jgi:hypothetical protein
MTHAFRFLGAAAAVLAAARVEAAQVVVINGCGETLQIGVYCRDHSHWQPMAGNFQAVSLNSNRRVTLPNVHTGNFTISAKTRDNVQIYEKVVLHEGVNRFSIDYVMQAPGAPPPWVRRPMPRQAMRPQIGISRLLDDREPEVGPDLGGVDIGGGGAAAPGDEVYVPHMGIYYQPVPYDNGTFGARLTRDAAGGTPAAQIRLSNGPSRLERGDTIFEMDGMRFRTPADFRNHRAYTTMRFIDSRTGRTYWASFNLP